MGDQETMEVEGNRRDVAVELELQLDLAKWARHTVMPYHAMPPTRLQHALTGPETRKKKPKLETRRSCRAGTASLRFNRADKPERKQIIFLLLSAHMTFKICSKACYGRLLG